MWLSIPNDRPKCASTWEGELVKTNLWHLPNWLCRQRHDASKQGVACGLDAHAIRDASAQSASSRQTKRLEQLKEPYGQTRTGSNKGG
jgi:hypothetical protein